MIRVTFYCDIQSPNGKVLERDFDFDSGDFETQEELMRYCANNNYEIGQPCAYWGNDVGILTEIFQDEI